jgi:glucan phosphoethanolaminetransferase (alkaline phosphatase superfamily)
MKLDDLKQTWKQNQPTKPLNTDIMELIQHKSYGPIAALKKAFRKQIVLMAVIPAFFIVSNADNLTAVLNSIILWCYIAFCMGVIVFSYYNYRIVNKMEGMDNLVKSNLEQQLNLLETRMKWKKKGLMLALIFFILLVEIVPYLQHYRMLDKWHSVPMVIRCLVYAALFALQYFANTWVNERRYGRHLKYLNELVQEMQS